MNTYDELLAAVVQLVTELDPAPDGLVERVQRRIADERACEAEPRAA
jgi:hypothetical protein